MTVSDLCNEYGLETDDIRWGLCHTVAERIAELVAERRVEDLTEWLRSGELSDQLYDMEERWFRETEDRLSRGVLDEGHLRDQLATMVMLKSRRA